MSTTAEKDKAAFLRHLAQRNVKTIYQSAKRRSEELKRASEKTIKTAKTPNAEDTEIDGF